MPIASHYHRAPVLIGVDWGTSSFRAYLIDADGQVIDKVSARKGILHVKNGAFGATLEGMIGTWRKPGLPVVLSGMIGSRQGWIEVPYVQTPACFKAVAVGMVHHPDDPSIHLAPGLAHDLPGQAPDVMRGEETQIIGAIGDEATRRLLVMPGTHSKWVLVEDRTIVWFATFMTGELFAVLKDHSILGRLITAADGDGDAFEQGLSARTHLAGGLLQQLFSARTLSLFDRLPERGVAAYLSGLLIGHEVSEALGNLEAPPDRTPVTVIGTSALADRYITALDKAGLPAEKAAGDAAAVGHFRLALMANILPSSTGAPS